MTQEMETSFARQNMMHMLEAVDAPKRRDALADVPLMTTREPKRVAQSEKAWMRTAAYLIAQGPICCYTCYR